MNEYYSGKLKQGEEYQDFVTDYLRKMTPCIIMMNYSSRKYQYEHGESANGLEVKYDGRLHETGNLYIEVLEKSDPYLQNYTPSGIMRDDNTWLYLIGDYEQAFIFSKKHLRELYEDHLNQRRRLEMRKIDTSQGFLLKADGEPCKRICIMHIRFSEQGDIYDVKGDQSS